MNNLFKAAVLAVSLLLFSLNGFAASSQSVGEQVFTSDEIAKFSKQVERTLAAKGARVVIVSRVGMPAKKMPRGFRYTHTGIAVYSIITTNDGKQVPGYTMYNLYQKNNQPNQSELVQDFPVDFFSGVYELEAGIIIPKLELQKRLINVINSANYQALHNSAYSAIANPFNSQYQNCTEFILDVVNSAIYETTDIEQLKRNSQEYFQAQRVRVNPIKMLIGSMFSSEIAISDHEDKIETATFTTIAKYLEDYDLVQEQFSISAR